MIIKKYLFCFALVKIFKSLAMEEALSEKELPWMAF